MANNLPRASIPDPAAQKRKQTILLVGGGLGLIGVIATLVMMQSGAPTAYSERTSKEVKKDFMVSGKQLSDKEVWTAKSESELKELRTDKDNMKRQLELLRRDFDSGRTGARGVDVSSFPPPPPMAPVAGAPGGNGVMVPPSNLPPPPPTRDAKDAVRNLFQVAPPPPRVGGASEVPPGGFLASHAANDQMTNGIYGQQSANGTPPRNMQAPGVIQAGNMMGLGQGPVPESKVFRIEIDAGPQAAATPDGKPGSANAKENKKADAQTYIPAGSFVHGVLLGGVDAPAATTAQNNPHPVLIRVKDLAILPNKFRSNVKECLVVGAAYGDLSSERAYIRTETLSCVQNDGQVIEAKVKGYIVGEDGKTGMRGRLVEKQGQMIARAMLAGTLSGLGKGLSASYSTTITGGTGIGTVPDPSKSLQTGLAEGLSTGMDKVADYYLKLADATAPVIEIDAMRQVDIVFTSGITLEGVLGKRKS